MDTYHKPYFNSFKQLIVTNTLLDVPKAGLENVSS